MHEGVKVIALCFKAKQQDEAGTNKLFKVVRRFSLHDSTWGNVLDFVESLELRPYGSPLEITFGIPLTRITRVNEDEMLSVAAINLGNRAVLQINFTND